MTNDKFLRKYSILESDSEKIIRGADYMSNSKLPLIRSSEPFSQWATSAAHLIKLSHGEGGVHYQEFISERNKAKQPNGFIGFRHFELCRGIFLSAKRDYEEGFTEKQLNPELDLVITLCSRIKKVAGILGNRERSNKKALSYKIEDEYDVQDLLQAMLRGYFKYTVQENTLEKVAGVKSGKPDISIEELGILIEIKYAREPGDKQTFIKAFGEDQLLYPKWQFLKTLIILIYNSNQLKDPDLFETMNKTPVGDGKSYDVKVILS